MKLSDQFSDLSPLAPRELTSRRGFLRRAGALAAAGSILAVSRGSALAAPKQNSLGKRNKYGLRMAAAKNIRQQAAQEQTSLPDPNNISNGDETSLPGYAGSFTKALPHNSLGEVDAAAYAALLRALETQATADWSAVPLGGNRLLANPQASLAFSLVGADSHSFPMPPAPRFSSAEQAAEMGELYLHALARDVAFDRYASDPIAAYAVAQLNGFSDFRGPKSGGAVTPGTLFRGSFKGDLFGNYVSQFLLLDCPQGSATLTQRYRVPKVGDDHMVDPAEWLAIQNGASPSGQNQIDPVPRYITTARDLGEYVHTDYTYQSYLQAALILLGIGAPLDTRNPYAFIQNQGAFVTFGAAEILSLVAEAGLLGLKAAWHQKWQVHRRLRPEAFGGCVHFTRSGARSDAIHEELLASPILEAVALNQGGSYFLPMAYPEGSPTHPAYPAGHAVIAGACVTVLKALFDGDYVLPAPVEVDPASDGTALRPYSGSANLTVEGELNKLANNIAIGRNLAGVHWRTDGTEGILLGEKVAIQMLKDIKRTYPEEVEDYELTGFLGETLRI